jgi:hypothetical protein
MTEMASNLEEMFFFLRALRVLRGGISFFGCGSAVPFLVNTVPH